MICPNCGYDNVPGDESCKHCEMDLTQLDRPVAQNRLERCLMEDLVSALKPREAVVACLQATVGQALDKMLAANLGALLVIDSEGKLRGIFSERDLLTRVAGIYECWEDLSVCEVMTPDPETVSLTDTLALALQKMDVGGYRHLPVVEGGKPVGVISVRDMMRHLTRLCK
jgi:CBS domain-containing protein